jgi:CHAD domain-containing protein
MANRAQRTLVRAAEDRKAQIAAATVVVTGAAVAGKAGIEKLRENGNGGPSRAYRLKSKEKPKQGLRRIARGRAQNALDELEDPGPASVHEARKDLKKMRSLLRLVRDDLGKGFYRTENKRYRDAGRRLSAARDAEVKLETLASLRERFDEELDDDALKGFAEALEAERKATAEAIEGDSTAVAEAAKAINLGRNRVSGWKLQPRGWALVGPGFVRTYGRGRREMKKVLEEPSDENVHEWRKRAKDLWYQLRILREAWPEVIGPSADQAHELGDLLGDHHDLAVLAADAREQKGLFADPGDAERITKLARRRQDELLERALPLGRCLYAEKPKAFGRRFEAYWKTWRPA